MGFVGGVSFLMLGRRREVMRLGLFQLKSMELTMSRVGVEKDEEGGQFGNGLMSVLRGSTGWEELVCVHEKKKASFMGEREVCMAGGCLLVVGFRSVD